MKLLKLFYISLFSLISLKGFTGAEETTYLKLTEFKPCNISSASIPRSNIQKDIRNLTDLYNRTKDFDLKIFVDKFEKFIFSKKSFSCFEKVNLIKLYAGYQYSIQNPIYSEKLYQNLKKFRGLDNKFQKFIDIRISASKQARFAQDKVASESIDNIQKSEQKHKAEIDENENRIFFLEKELKELKELLKIEKGQNLQYLLTIQENEELRNELEKVKKSNQEVLLENDNNLQSSSLKKEYNQTLEDLEKVNEQLHLMSINLDNTEKSLRNSQSDVDLLTSELSKYKMLSESDLQIYTAENFIDDDNSLFWLWTAFFIALFSAFYFYNENLRKEDSGNPHNIDDLANALEGILQQIQPHENLDKFMDPYIFNYIRGYCEGFINSDLESKILLHELMSSLSSKSYFEHNKNYITDDSDLALEGRMKGKQDGQRLRNNSMPVILRNYLKKDVKPK